jgi:hypothetical protein
LIRFIVISPLTIKRCLPNGCQPTIWWQSNADASAFNAISLANPKKSVRQMSKSSGVLTTMTQKTDSPDLGTE